MQMIYAHRGASAYAPENTLEAFYIAAKMGADGVELDVHVTKDGELVVAHDEEIDRVSDGSGLIQNMTLAQLRQFHFNKTHPEYVYATIPTLREVYELLKPMGLCVNTELKTSIIRYDKIEEKCIALADEMGMTDRVLYSSFSFYSLTKLKSLDSRAKVGLLRLPLGTLNGRKLFDPWEFASKHGLDAIHPHHSEFLIHQEADKAHSLKMQVNVWTTNDDFIIRSCFKKGADILIGDCPDRMLKIRNEINEEDARASETEMFSQEAQAEEERQKAAKKAEAEAQAEKDRMAAIEKAQAEEIEKAAREALTQV